MYTYMLYIYDNNWMCVCMSPCVVYRFPQRQLWWMEMWHWTSSDGIRQVITLVLRMTWDAFTSMTLERWDFVLQMLFVLTPSLCAHAGFCVAQDLQNNWPTSEEEFFFLPDLNITPQQLITCFFFFCFFLSTLWPKTNRKVLLFWKVG